MPPGFASQEAFAAYLHDGPPAKSEIHVETGNLMLMLKPKKKVLPVYPESAKAAGVVEGKVQLRVSVSKDGKVEGVTSSGTKMLLQSAEEAVKQYEFEPMMLNGKPVGVIGSISVTYSLSAEQPVAYK